MKGLLLTFISVGLLSSLSYLSYAQEASLPLGDQGGLTEANVAAESTHSELVEESENSGIANKISLNYFGLLYGPSVQNPSSHQPDANGVPDLSRPVLLRNFLGLGYNISNDVAVSGTFQWTWQPVLDHEAQIQDPFFKISHNSILRFGDLNLYGDLRVHFPVSTAAHINNFTLGVQTVEALTYPVPRTDLLLGLVASMRVNRFGDQGFGNDIELYFAPNLSYQLTQTFALTTLYEIYQNHGYGDTFLNFHGDGTALETGVAWDISPRLAFNPYLHLPISGNLNLNSTSIGMTLNLALI